MGVYDAFEKLLSCRVRVDGPPQFSNFMVYANGAKFEGKLPKGVLHVYLGTSLLTFRSVILGLIKS